MGHPVFILSIVPTIYPDNVQNVLEHLVLRCGGVHEEALDGLLGLLLRAPLDECLANGDLGEGDKKAMF